MHTIRRIAARSLVLLVFAACATGAAFAQSPDGFYRVEGQSIVPPEGAPEMLRGIGLGGWLMPEGYMLRIPGFGSPSSMNEQIVDVVGEADAAEFWRLFRQFYVQEKDIAAIADWGFDHIRLPFHYNVLFDLETRTFKEEGFDLFDEFLTWCEAYGLYVVLDMHAAPGAQSEHNISDSDGSARLWTEPDPYQDITVEIWEEIARRYVDDTRIIGYDFINEPVTPDEIADGGAALRSLYERLTEAVRAIDTNHIIFIEGNWFATDFANLTPPFDDNMVYSFHKYWNSPTQGTIQYLLDLRAEHDVPLWMGESGENSNAWFFAVTRLLEKLDIPWNWWTHKKISTTTSPLSTPLLPGYQRLIDYWNGTGGKPAPAVAREALFAQARMLHIDSTRSNPGVVPALIDPEYGSVQKPLKDHAIPGVVNAADYDIGNQGIAYSDSDYWTTGGSPGIGNNGSRYRNDGVDIEESLDPQGYEYNVGWLETFEWMEYTVQVTETGTYRVDARVASPGGGALTLQVDGETVGTFDAPATGGWQNWATATIPEVHLEAGTHVLRIVVGRSPELNFNRMTFTKLPSTDVENPGEVPDSPGFGSLYPNPATDEIRLDVSAAPGTHLSVDVYDLLGRNVLREKDVMGGGSDTTFIDVASLPSGTYVVVGTLDDGARRTSVTRPASIVR